MITDERLASFINSFGGTYDEVVTSIRQKAEEQNIPIIRKETGEFIKLLMMIHRPVQVLEIGTAVGFSAIFMSRFLPEKGHIITIENYPPRISQAKENIRLADAGDLITLIEGDANEVLPKLSGTFDFIFMDAAKGQYGSYFTKIIPMLAPSGILLCDNVLQDGDVLESRFAVTRRNRTIHARMREFLYDLTHDERIETAILNIGDGMSLSIKKEVHTDGE